MWFQEVCDEKDATYSYYSHVCLFKKSPLSLVSLNAIKWEKKSLETDVTLCVDCASIKKKLN